MNYYKITNENERHRGLSYKTGLNQDIMRFFPYGDCEPGGIYFSREHILTFLPYGPWVREVTVPTGAQLYLNGGQIIKWKADKVMLGERRRITADVIRELVAEGAEDKLCPAIAFNAHPGREMMTSIIEVFGKDLRYPSLGVVNGEYYLYQTNDRALDVGLKNTFSPEIAQVLIDLGADIHFEEDAALIKAVSTGNLDLISVLLKAGADPNCALQIALDNNDSSATNLLTEEIKK